VEFISIFSRRFVNSAAEGACSWTVRNLCKIRGMDSGYGVTEENEKYFLRRRIYRGV
jgi:hypothetical protein